MKKALILLGIAATLAGCGSSSDSGGEDYPKEARDAFVSDCVKSGGGESVRERCTCVIDKLEDTVDYEDFKAVDAALRKGQEGDKEVVDDIEKAATECRKEG